MARRFRILDSERIDPREIPPAHPRALEPVSEMRGAERAAEIRNAIIGDGFGSAMASFGEIAHDLIRTPI
jgi:hypothetical protein